MRPGLNPLEQHLRQTRRVNDWESAILDRREDVFGFLNPNFNQLHQALNTSDDQGRLPLIYFIAIATNEQLEQLFSNQAVLPFLEKLLGKNPVSDIIHSEKLIAIKYIVSDKITHIFICDNFGENFFSAIARNKNLEVIKYFLSDQLPDRVRRVLLNYRISITGTDFYPEGGDHTSCLFHHFHTSFLNKIALNGTLDAIQFVLSNALTDTWAACLNPASFFDAISKNGDLDAIRYVLSGEFSAKYKEKFDYLGFFRKCALSKKLNVLDYFLSDEFSNSATQDQLKFLNHDFLEWADVGCSGLVAKLYLTKRPEMSAISHNTKYRNDAYVFGYYGTHWNDVKTCIIESITQLLNKAQKNSSSLRFEDIRLIVAFQKHAPKHFDDVLISITPEQKEALFNILKTHKETSDIDQLSLKLTAQEEALTADIALLKNKSVNGGSLGFFENRDWNLKPKKRNVINAAIAFISAKKNGSDANIQAALFEAFQLALRNPSNKDWNSGFRNTTENLVDDTLRLARVTYNPRMKNPSDAVVVPAATSGAAPAASAGPAPIVAVAPIAMSGVAAVPAGPATVVANNNTSTQQLLSRPVDLPVQPSQPIRATLFGTNNDELLAGVVVPQGSLVATVSAQRHVEESDDLDQQLVLG